MVTASPICLQLERHADCRAFSRAWANTGKRIAARIAMIAITTRSSMRVNPDARCGIRDARYGIWDGERAPDRVSTSRVSYPVSRIPYLASRILYLASQRA